MPTLSRLERRRARDRLACLPSGLTHYLIGELRSERRPSPRRRCLVRRLLRYRAIASSSVPSVLEISLTVRGRVWETPKLEVRLTTEKCVKNCKYKCSLTINKQTVRVDTRGRLATTSAFSVPGSEQVMAISILSIQTYVAASLQSCRHSRILHYIWM